MQNNSIQTNQKDPDYGGLDGNWDIPEAIRLLWCAREDLNLHEQMFTSP
jgi:hypothetical protein